VDGPGEHHGACNHGNACKGSRAARAAAASTPWTRPSGARARPTWPRRSRPSWASWSAGRGPSPAPPRAPATGSRPRQARVTPRPRVDRPSRVG